MSDRLEEDLKLRIKSYWIKINRIEERIGELARKNVGYSSETLKRKNLIRNVRLLDNKLKKCLITGEGVSNG